MYFAVSHLNVLDLFIGWSGVPHLLWLLKGFPSHIDIPVCLGPITCFHALKRPSGPNLCSTPAVCFDCGSYIAKCLPVDCREQPALGHIPAARSLAGTSLLVPPSRLPRLSLLLLDLLLVLCTADTWIKHLQFLYCEYDIVDRTSELSHIYWMDAMLGRYKAPQSHGVLKIVSKNTWNTTVISQCSIVLFWSSTEQLV